MAKADKSTKRQRIEQVERLMIHGAGTAEIRKLAELQQWNVGERQLRRYASEVNRRFAKAADQDRKQLLGRHQKQRDAMYTSAVKKGDTQLALGILKDQAKLQGLYPRGRNGAHSAVDEDPLKDPGRSSSLSRQERVSRLVAAESRGDAAEIQLLTEAMPWRFYRAPDTTAPLWQLHTLRHCFLVEQLEQLCVFVSATAKLDRAPVPRWKLLARISAYRIVVGEAGWEAFLRSIGINDTPLAADQQQPMLLELWRDRIWYLAPTRQQLVTEIQLAGLPSPRLVVAADFAKRWRDAWATFDE